jgi:hypothetical protein
VLIVLSEMRTLDYAILLKGRPVTAFMPLRFAFAHRLFAARAIRFLPSSERRPRVAWLALAGGFLATRAFTTSLARTIDALAESSKLRNPRALAGHWSMTVDSNASTLFNRFRAFFTFMTPPGDRPCYHRAHIRATLVMKNPSPQTSTTATHAAKSAFEISRARQSAPESSVDKGACSHR